MPNLRFTENQSKLAPMTELLPDLIGDPREFSRMRKIALNVAKALKRQTAEPAAVIRAISHCEHEPSFFKSEEITDEGIALTELEVERAASQEAHLSGHDGYWPVRIDGSVIESSPTMRHIPLPPGGDKVIGDLIEAELKEKNDEALGDVD